MAENKNKNSVQEDETFVLTDDEGNETYYTFLRNISYKGNKYVVLESRNDEDYFDDEEDGGVCIILQVKTNKKGEKDYFGVNDETVLDAVFNQFLKEIGQEE